MTFTRGMYQHWKGGMYFAHMVVSNSTNGATHQAMVVYLSLDRGGWHVRDLDQWGEEVLGDDGNLIPRFRLVKASL